MTETTTARTSPTSLTVLRVAAVLTALGTIAQAALGGSLATGDMSGLETHNVVAMITLAAAIVAAVAAGLLARAGGNRGLMWHALSVAVIALIQFGLGEAGPVMVHIVLGIILLVAALGLATLAIRRPFPTARR